MYYKLNIVLYRNVHRHKTGAKLLEETRHLEVNKGLKSFKKTMTL